MQTGQTYEIKIGKRYSRFKVLGFRDSFTVICQRLDNGDIVPVSRKKLNALQANGNIIEIKGA